MMIFPALNKMYQERKKKKTNGEKQGKKWRYNINAKEKKDFAESEINKSVVKTLDFAEREGQK